MLALIDVGTAHTIEELESGVHGPHTAALPKDIKDNLRTQPEWRGFLEKEAIDAVIRDAETRAEHLREKDN